MTLMIILTILTVLILLCLAVVVWDCHHFVVRKYSVTSPKITRDFKFVLLTDLHNNTFGKNNQKLLDAVCNIEPDFVVIGGDIYTAICGKSMTDVSVAFVTELAGKFPVYFANGNHEQKTKESVEEFGNVYEDFISEFCKAQGHFLCNESTDIEELNTRITGLALPFEYYKKFINIHPDKSILNEMLNEPSKDRYNILIAHNPEYFPDYADWGAELVLSGHFHGGLVRLPFIGGIVSPRYKLFPKYDAGMYKKEASTMILSCGLGTHTLPIRFNNPGEISLVEVSKE